MLRWFKDIWTEEGRAKIRTRRCPLRPEKLPSMKWKVKDLKAIEDHVSSRTKCHHQLNLKDLRLTQCLIKSPLLAACWHGDLDAVRRIVERWGVDIQATSIVSLIYQEESLENGWLAAIKTTNTFLKVKVTPFFIAVIRGDIKIVNYLIDKGADVSARATLKSGDLAFDATPLHGVSLFVSKNVRNVTVEENYLDLFQLLLDKGANINDRDQSGLTPFLIYASYWNPLRRNELLFDFIVSRDDIETKDKMYALDLSVSMFFLNSFLHARLPMVLEYWTKARSILNLTEGFSATIPETSTSNERAVEWITSAKIEEIQNLPLSDLKMQAILIQFRIFSSIGWGAVCYHLWPRLIRFLQRKLLNGQFTEVLHLTWKMLETVRLFDPREKGVWKRTVQVASILEHINIDDLVFNSETMMKTLELIVETDQSHLPNASREEVNLGQHMEKVLLHLIRIVSSYAKIEDKTMRSLFQLVRRDGRDQRGRNLLLLACMQSEPLASVGLLLKIGANPDVVDENDDGPLHILSKSQDDQVDSTARLLLNAGAHLDRVNQQGMTAADLYFRVKGLREDPDLLPDWYKETVPPLKCLSARVVRRQNLLNLDNVEPLLPRTVVPFVAIH